MSARSRSPAQAPSPPSCPGWSAPPPGTRSAPRTRPATPPARAEPPRHRPGPPRCLRWPAPASSACAPPERHPSPVPQRGRPGACPPGAARRAPVRGATARPRTGGLRRLLTASTSFPALGSTAVVMMSDGEHLTDAAAAVQRVVAEFDHACSRFRADSELETLNRAGGRPQAVSALLREAVRAAVRAAQLTDGDVDPTLGAALIALGYDRDFSLGVDGRGADAGHGRGRRGPTRAPALVDHRGGLARDRGRRRRRHRDRSARGAGSTSAQPPRRWPPTTPRRPRRRPPAAAPAGCWSASVAISPPPGRPRWPAGRSASLTITARGSMPRGRRSRSPRVVWPPRASPCAAGARRASCATICSIRPVGVPRRAPGERSAWRRRHAWTPTSPRRRQSCAVSGPSRGWRRPAYRAGWSAGTVAPGISPAGRPPATISPLSAWATGRRGRGMTPLAAVGPSLYWYLTRGSGAVALRAADDQRGGRDRRLAARISAPAWPRFAVETMHRDVSLLVIVFLVIHIVTSVLDSFAPISLTAAVIPFISSYRPLWLGLGTLSFDLILALTHHQPDPPSPRLRELAGRALAGLRELARGGAARARDRQRHQGRLDARADRGCAWPRSSPPPGCASDAARGRRRPAGPAVALSVIVPGRDRRLRARRPPAEGMGQEGRDARDAARARRPGPGRLRRPGRRAGPVGGLAEPVLGRAVGHG